MTPELFLTALVVGKFVGAEFDATAERGACDGVETGAGVGAAVGMREEAGASAKGSDIKGMVERGLGADAADEPL